MRRMLGIALAVLFMAAAGHASAQVPDATRDCQALLKCNYAKGGSFRGCISA